MWSIYKVKVTEKVVLPDVFNLNDSVMNKNHRDQTQFSPEKNYSRKRKMSLLLSVYSLSAIR